MFTIKTPLELYKRLPRTNCGDCGMASCLAFAAAVIREEKRLPDCPHLGRDAAAALEGRIRKQVNIESIREEQLIELKKKICTVDILSRAAKLGGTANGKTIVIKCLGRDFEIDARGGVASQCHTHAWFTLPLLDYLLHSQGREATGQWVPFRELEHGKTWAPLFEQRCEKPLKVIADSYNDLFEDLISLFSGTTAHDRFESDIAVVLHPLPTVPVLICYWRPDEGMESKLHIFFDATAEQNLPIESLFTLGTGLVRMFEKIMHRHTGGKSALS
ncbi:MAG: DUF3786 domain-containing protein [Nitrospirota bacterium]